MKTLSVLIFVGIITLLMGSLHWLIWSRLVQSAQWPDPWGFWLTLMLFGLGVIIPLAVLALRFGPRWITKSMSWVGYIWMGFVFYLFLLVLTVNAGHHVAKLFGLLPNNPTDLLQLARILSLGIILCAVVICGVGIQQALRGFKIKQVQVPLVKLAAEHSGYSIIQISDLHVGPTIGKKEVQRVVDKTNALNPDMIVITGDLVDGTVTQLRSHVEPLRGLMAKDGVFFVTGNHEYYSGAEEWVDLIRSLGIRVLRNEGMDIRGVFHLAGVDDISAARFLPGHGQDVQKAVAGRESARPLVLLAHQPKSFQEAVNSAVDLQLSGHVHAGQMFPFNWLAKLDQPFIVGLHRIEKMWLYVNAGTGYWGPPMRVGTASELTRIELVAHSHIA